jgi:hypothetical protein
MEALPRFNPKAAKFTTFVYGLARRRMWLVARAAFYGLSPEQMHRHDAAKRTPRFHYDVNSRRRRGFRQPEADTEPRESVRKVDAIRQSLPRQDCLLLDMWLQESGNVSEVARRLHRERTGIQGRYHRLFRRIAAANEEPAASGRGAFISERFAHARSIFRERITYHTLEV